MESELSSSFLSKDILDSPYCVTGVRKDIRAYKPPVSRHNNTVMERMQDYGALKSAISKLQGLSIESQTAIISVINRLAEAVGVSPRTGFKLPLENIGVSF